MNRQSREMCIGQCFNIAIVWIGDRLKVDSLPKSVRGHQRGKDGSEYLPIFMLTAQEEPINLIEYCTHIAKAENTFVTCIQAGWYESDWHQLGHSDQERNLRVTEE